MQADLILPEVIDSTMISCWRACQTKMRNEFLEGRRPGDLSIDLHAGACLAYAIETVSRAVWEQNKTLDEALVLAQGEFAFRWGNFQIPQHKKTTKTFDRVWAAVEEYFKKWPPKTDYIQPYTDAAGKRTYEYTFAIPLEPTVEPDGSPIDYDPLSHPNTFPTHPVTGGPFLYGGRFDLLGYNVNTSRPIIRDEKSTRGVGDKWAEQWELRNQFLGYVWACQQCGIDVDQVCIRGVAILTNDIKLPEVEKTYSRHLIERWHEQLRRDIWAIRRAWDLQEFDHNYAESCTAYGNCAFMASCQSATPAVWLNEFAVRRWNPLLKNPTEMTNA